MTIERILEAEIKSEQKVGDSSFQYLRVGPTSMVPPDYAVSFYFLNLSFKFLQTIFFLI